MARGAASGGQDPRPPTLVSDPFRSRPGGSGTGQLNPMTVKTAPFKARDVRIHTKASASSAAPENAKVFVQAPCEALSPFVKRFAIVEFPLDRKLKLLPDTSFVAEFRFKGDGALDGRANLPRASI